MREEQAIEETKAELRDWVVRNCLLDRIKVEEVVEKMYNNLQDIGRDLVARMNLPTNSRGPG